MCYKATESTKHLELDNKKTKDTMHDVLCDGRTVMYIIICPH